MKEIVSHKRASISQLKLQIGLTCSSVFNLFLCLERLEHSKIINDSNKNSVEGAAICKCFKLAFRIALTLRLNLSHTSACSSCLKYTKIALHTEMLKLQICQKIRKAKRSRVCIQRQQDLSKHKLFACAFSQSFVWNLP